MMMDSVDQLFPTSLEDERSGVWTKVDVGPESVTIRLRANHSMGLLFGAGVVAFLVYCFSLTPMAFSVLVPFLIAMLLQNWSKHRKLSSAFPIVLSNRGCDLSSLGGRVFRFDKVEALAIRRNAHREPTDDCELVQLYMILKGDQKPVLIYQQFYSGRNTNRVAQIANDVAHLLGVEVFDATEQP